MQLELTSDNKKLLIPLQLHARYDAITSIIASIDSDHQS